MPAYFGAVAREVVEAVRERHHGPPGRHRAVPAGTVEALVAHRAGAQPGVPRGVLRRAAGGERSAGAGDRCSGSRAAACRWSTGSRSRSSRKASRAGSRSSMASRTRSTCRSEFINIAAPERPDRTRAGRSAASSSTASCNPDIVVTYFNMDDPVVGGYTPEKVALAARDQPRLRRATRRSAWFARGAMVPAQSQIPPLTTGYDPTFSQRDGRFDRARGTRAAGHLRLRGPRRRRLARTAGRLPAGARNSRRSRASSTAPSTNCGSASSMRSDCRCSSASTSGRKT